MWSRFAFCVGAAMVIGFAKSGDLLLTAKVVAWLTPIFLLASYFSSKKGVASTRGERVIAYGWLTIRRFFCFAGAALFFAAALSVTVLEPLTTDLLIGAIGVVALSVFLVWFGMYGEERHGHIKRMERYDLGKSKDVDGNH